MENKNYKQKILGGARNWFLVTIGAMIINSISYFAFPVSCTVFFCLSGSMIVWVITSFIWWYFTLNLLLPDTSWKIVRGTIIALISLYISVVFFTSSPVVSLPILIAQGLHIPLNYSK